jgi:hypothetical protein
VRMRTLTSVGNIPLPASSHAIKTCSTLFM